MRLVSKMHSAGSAFAFCLILHLIEGRVYCQDKHASPWIPLGYTCPVMCQNILNAIERLKMLDYRKMVEEDRKNRDNINKEYLTAFINDTSSELDQDESVKKLTNNNNYKTSWNNNYITHNKSLRDKEYIDGMKTIPNKDEIQLTDNQNKIKFDINIDNSIETSAEAHDKMASKQNGVINEYEKFKEIITAFEFDRNDVGDFAEFENSKAFTETTQPKYGDVFEVELKKAFENRTCDWFGGAEPYVLIKKIIRKCDRRSRRNGYNQDFLRSLMRTMNRFSKAPFEFTEDMVELVLERVFGKTVATRNELLDMNKLLRYLRNSMVMHKEHSQRETTITLKPRHCMTISMPGCFCRPGYVEKAGQCVVPEDCVSDEASEDYLARIVVY